MSIDFMKVAVQRRSIQILDSLGFRMEGADPIFGWWALDALRSGPNHRWWLSARLLLKISHDDAMRMCQNDPPA